MKQGFLAEDLAKFEADLASNGSTSGLGTQAVAVSTPKAMEKEEAAEAEDGEEEEDEEEVEEEVEDEEKGDEDDDDDDSTDSDSSEDDDDFLTRALEQDMG